MKKIFFFLVTLFLFGCATAQIDPAYQLKRASGAGFCLISDAQGRFQITPCSTIGGGNGTDDTFLANGRKSGSNWLFDRVTSTGQVVDTESFPLADLLQAFDFSTLTTEQLTDLLQAFDFSQLTQSQIDEISQLIDFSKLTTNQINIIRNLFTFQNAITRTNGLVELGGTLTKNTLVSDPTDSKDLVFQKGTTSFGFENSDMMGEKGWNVTSGDATSDYGILRAKPGFMSMYVRDMDSTRTAGFYVTPSFLAMTKDNVTLNGKSTLAMFGNGLHLQTVTGQNTSGLSMVAGDFNLYAVKSNGTIGTGIGSNGDSLAIETTTIKKGTAKNGMFLKLLNEELGTVDYDYDRDNQNLTWNPTTNTIGIEGGNSFMLPINSSGGDNWGAQAAVTDNTLTGNGTGTNPLKVANPFGEYSYEIGALDDGVFIISNHQGVSYGYSRNQNTVTITIPAGKAPKYIEVFGNVANFTQEDFNVNLVYQGVSYNDTYTRARNPLSVNFLRSFGRRTPSAAQYWNYDNDAAPSSQKQITSLGGGAIQVTYKNVQSSGTNSFICLIAP